MLSLRNIKLFTVILCLSAAAGCGGGGGEKNPADAGAGNITGNAGNIPPAPAVDSTPPTVTSTDPADGQTLTAAPASVRVNFSEPMDPSSVKAAFQLLQRQFSIAPGNSAAPDNGSNFVAVPVAEPVVTNNNQSFNFSLAVPVVRRRLRIVVGTAAKDRNGNALAQEFKAAFRIGQEVAGIPAEAPMVVGFTPPNGSTNVARQVIIGVTFNQVMQFAHVRGAFSLLRLEKDSVGNFFEKEAIAGELQACADNKTFFFTPNQMLDRTEKYKIRVNAGAQNEAGVDLAQDFTSTFDTRFTLFGDVAIIPCP